MEKVSSRQNALVRRFRGLAQGRDADDDAVLLDGAHLVEEALGSGVTIETAAFADSALATRLGALASRVERSGARTLVAPDALFRSLSPVQHPTGVVAIARMKEASMDDLVGERPPLLLLLDAVQDPGNIGGIIRAAEACGATGVILGPGCADAFSWKALRGAMGSSFRLPIVRRVGMLEAIRRVRAAGVRVLAAVPRDGTLLPECDLRGPSAILLGGEGTGLSNELLQAVDGRLTIPMKAPVESLNVAIASALLVYEASRQRTNVALRRS